MSDLTDEQLRAIEFRHRDCADCDEAVMAVELRRHRAAKRADAERVRGVVCDVVKSWVSNNAPAATDAERLIAGEVMGIAIAGRAAEQLAGVVVGLSEEELRGLQLMRRHLDEGGHDWRDGTAMSDVEAARVALDRLLASPPATLTQIISAAAARFDSRPIEMASIEARRELASPPAPDLRAGILALIADDTLTAEALRKALAELVGGETP